jgi:uncharacterized protein (DUF433 family)
VVRNNQDAFNEVVEGYLRRLDFGDDGYAQLIHLPAYDAADVVVDPMRGFGQPIFARGKARVGDALALFRAGEPLEVVAEEYGIPPEQLEDAVRIATRVAAGDALGAPSGSPDHFLDRSLGRVQVPSLLRAAGLPVRTLAEEYGMPADENVTDIDWLAHAGRSGWPALGAGRGVLHGLRS